jgi:hypothetical protein
MKNFDLTREIRSDLQALTQRRLLSPEHRARWGVRGLLQQAPKVVVQITDGLDKSQFFDVEKMAAEEDGATRMDVIDAFHAVFSENPAAAVLTVIGKNDQDILVGSIRMIKANTEEVLQRRIR